MKFGQFVNEQEDEKKVARTVNIAKKKMRSTLKTQLQKLDNDIDKIMDNVENEIEKIDENPTFKNKLAQMLVNSEKESGEFIIALRQLINTLSRNANIIPDVRGHAEGIPRDDNQEVTKKDTNTPKIISKKELEKAVK
jgi:hypothetical protein